MAERNEKVVSSSDSSITEDAKPRYSAKRTEYLSFPMLLLIFKYLSVYDLLRRVGLVCKSWYHVARDRELWMTVDLSEQQKLKPRDLLKLLSFSNFRIIDLHLPHRGQEGRFSVHEERLLILLLRKCQCLRVLQFCQRCWESLSTDAVQEANSSLEIKVDCCTAHPGLGSQRWLHPLLSNFLFQSEFCSRLANKSLLSPHLYNMVPSYHEHLIESEDIHLNDIECYRPKIPLFYPTIKNNLPDVGISFRRSFTDHTKSLIEERIVFQDRKLEEKMQDVNKSGNPKPGLGPYNNIMRQARKCRRQKYELRPPVNIVKQTKRYHQPRKEQKKRSGQKHTKQ